MQRLASRLIHWWDTGWYDGWRGTWATIDGNYSIIIVTIIGKDVEWVAIACMVLMEQWHLSDGTGCCDVLDVVDTLGGGVVTTLGHGATTLRFGASTVGGVLHCPAMILVSSWIARMCLIMSSVNFGT